MHLQFHSTGFMLSMYTHWLQLDIKQPATSFKLQAGLNMRASLFILACLCMQALCTHALQF